MEDGSRGRRDVILRIDIAYLTRFFPAAIANGMANQGSDNIAAQPPGTFCLLANELTS
jgi:hypothetical protein